MSIKFSDLSKETKTTTVKVDDGLLALVYRPKALSAKAQLVGGRLMKIAEEAKKGLPANPQDVFEAVDGLVSVLSDTLVSWDLVDDEGEKIPPTRDWIERLPMGMLGDIYMAISEDASPNEKSAGA